jgi:hypothetical protein
MTITKNISAAFCLIYLALAAEGALAGPPIIDCGRTSNDQAVLQGVVNAASRGDIIHLKGVCEGVALVISKSGISVVGPAEIHGVADKVVVAVRDADGVTLRDLAVSDGTIGLEVNNARVTAENFTSERNSMYGIWSVGNGNLACVNCQANNNSTGLLTTGYLSLCGNSQFNDNAADGAFGFLGAQIFMIRSVCGGAPTLTLNRNNLGLHLFGNTSMFTDESTIQATQNRGMGILAYDNVVLAVAHSEVEVSFNGSVGLNMGASSSVRLNDTGGGSTTIANNSSVGLLVSQTGQLNAQNLALANNRFQDLGVSGFSLAQISGASSLGVVSCQPGKSTGSACPL